MDSTLKNYSDFLDAEIEARELGERVMEIEDARRTQAQVTKKKVIKAVGTDSELSIDATDYRRMMAKYEEFLTLKTEDEKRAALMGMKKGEKELMVKALQFRETIEEKEVKPIELSQESNAA